MHRFFVDENGIREGIASLDEEDARHALRVLRLRVGEQVELFSHGERYLAQIEAIEDRNVSARVLAQLPSSEPDVHITLFQGLPKAEKMEFIVQKCTELGVRDIRCVAMSRCVAQIKASDAAKKQQRWQKIAREAAKQCGRAYVPTVHAPRTLKELSSELEQMDLCLIPWEEAKDGSVRDCVKGTDAKNIGIVIGPEGGIEPSEAAYLEQLGGRLITLGPRILRTETAGIATLTMAMCLAGQME